jgi:hypothetical protein
VSSELLQHIDLCVLGQKEEGGVMISLLYDVWFAREE